MTSSAACPLCAGELAVGGGGQEAPTLLGGWPLRHCPACAHTCCPAAYGEKVDYDELYSAEYLAQQIEPLCDARRHAGLALLPPYLMFTQQLGPGGGRTLLDVGCGAGRFLVVAKRQGWQVRGSEPSGLAVQAATSAGMWLPVSTETPQELAAKGTRFDVVTLFDVLEHVADPAALLSACLPLLAPAGKLFVTLPNWDCRLMREAARADWLPPVHLQFFTRQSLRRLVAACGLRLVASGTLLTDPQPPQRGSGAWWRWLTRRWRGQPVHEAQLYALCEPDPDGLARGSARTC